MCAFITGQVGECGVGSKIASSARIELDKLCVMDLINDLIVCDPDDHGCWRPVRIYRSPGKGEYNSVAIGLEKRPSDNIFSIMKDRAKQYTKTYKGLIVKGFRFITEITTFNEEVI